MEPILGRERKKKSGGVFFLLNFQVHTHPLEREREKVFLPLAAMFAGASSSLFSLPFAPRWLRENCQNITIYDTRPPL